MFEVNVATDGIEIIFEDEPVLYWDIIDIQENAELGPQISEAIRIAYQEPEKLYKFLKDKNLLPKSE